MNKELKFQRNDRLIQMAPIKKENWRKIKESQRFKKKQKIEKRLEKELETSNVNKSIPEGIDVSLVKEQKTLSIAVAGSILMNAQSPELKSYLAGQIARAACIFNVDEVVVFNDLGDTPDEGMIFDKEKHKVWKSCVLLGRILQYLECPQYIRKILFPMHSDLQYAGLLNPLEAPHHLRADDLDFPFREGVITKKQTKKGCSSYANVGLRRDVLVDETLEPTTRVTVKLLPKAEGQKRKGILVPPSFPKASLGVYWGYEVRLARSLSYVIKECPYENGYDLVIGTSDSGQPIKTVDFPNYQHCIIFFGGLRGLEVAAENDEDLKIDDMFKLFHYYLNTCPNQGTRTLRTEEAILISLTSVCERLCS